MSTKTERVFYYDCLKCMAIFAVVFLHIAAGKWAVAEYTTYEWKVLNFYDSIVRWAVPIFVMVSGAIFLDTAKIPNIKKIYTKSVFRLFTAFLFWSILYALVSWKRGLEFNNAVLAIIKGNYHMWFVFMIAGLYIISPLLHKIVESDELTKYFLVIALIFTFIIPRGLQFITILDIPRVNSVIVAFQDAYSKMHFHFTVGYSSYFVAGHYFSKRQLSKKAERIIYILGILGFVLTIYLTWWYTMKEGMASTLFYDEFSVPVALETIAVFVFVKYRISKWKVLDKNKRVISKFARYGFGAYLVHATIIDYFRIHFGWHALTCNPIYMVPLLALGVWVISLAISAILNHIPIINKYIV